MPVTAWGGFCSCTIDFAGAQRLPHALPSWKRPGVGSPSMSLLCREGGDIWLQKPGSMDTLALLGQSRQSPVFLRDVTEAQEGPVRVCLQRLGRGHLALGCAPP